MTTTLPGPATGRRPTRQTLLTPVTRVDSGERADDGRRAELWLTESLDGVWRYERIDTVGTPWDVLHRPTGHIRRGFGTLRRARLWTGTTALDDIRADAERVIRLGGEIFIGRLRFPPPGLTVLERAEWKAARALEDAEEAAAQLAVARQTVAILDGALLPSGGLPETVCECGGYLVWLPAGWAHMNGCPECWSAAAGWIPGACSAPTRHSWCITPVPVQCKHLWCTSDMQTGVACQAPLEACCGCCVRDSEPVFDDK